MGSEKWERKVEIKGEREGEKAGRKMKNGTESKGVQEGQKLQTIVVIFVPPFGSQSLHLMLCIRAPLAPKWKHSTFHFQPICASILLSGSGHFRPTWSRKQVAFLGDF